MSSESVADFLQRRTKALQAFFTGDPEPWRDMLAGGPELSMFGGLGGAERGRDQVIERLGWASGSSTHGTFTRDVLATYGTEPVAVAVTLETIVPSVGEPRRLRVTEVYRLDNGRWTVCHRHADPHLAAAGHEERPGR